MTHLVTHVHDSTPCVQHVCNNTHLNALDQGLGWSVSCSPFHAGSAPKFLCAKNRGRAVRRAAPCLEGELFTPHSHLLYQRKVKLRAQSYSP